MHSCVVNVPICREGDFEGFVEYFKSGCDLQGISELWKINKTQFRLWPRSEKIMLLSPI